MSRAVPELRRTEVAREPCGIRVGVNIVRVVWCHLFELLIVHGVEQLVLPVENVRNDQRSAPFHVVFIALQLSLLGSHSRGSVVLGLKVIRVQPGPAHMVVHRTVELVGAGFQLYIERGTARMPVGGVVRVGDDFDLLYRIDRRNKRVPPDIAGFIAEAVDVELTLLRRAVRVLVARHVVVWAWIFRIREVVGAGSQREEIEYVTRIDRHFRDAIAFEEFAKIGLCGFDLGRAGIDGDYFGLSADTQCEVHRRCLVDIEQDVRFDFGLEALLGNRDVVGSRDRR